MQPVKTARHNLSWHVLATITADWEQWEEKAVAHFSTGVERKQRSVGETWMCAPVWHYLWFKQICSAGAAAEYRESHIRTPGSQLRTHKHTAVALALVRLYVTSLSPLPPSGWTTTTSPPLSVDAVKNGWNERATTAEGPCDGLVHKERHGKDSSHLSLSLFDSYHNKSAG